MQRLADKVAVSLDRVAALAGVVEEDVCGLGVRVSVVEEDVCGVIDVVGGEELFSVCASS